MADIFPRKPLTLNCTLELSAVPGDLLLFILLNTIKPNFTVIGPLN